MKTHVRNTSPVAALALVIVAASWLGCSTAIDSSSSIGPAPSFRNVTTDTRFVGDEACFECHEEQYLGYQDHGMARSYYPLTASNRVENTEDVRILDPHSKLVYTVREIDGALFQEEYEASSAGPKNVLRRRMDFVVGSGNAARTYLTEKNGAEV